MIGFSVCSPMLNSNHSWQQGPDSTCVLSDCRSAQLTTALNHMPVPSSPSALLCRLCSDPRASRFSRDNGAESGSDQMSVARGLCKACMWGCRAFPSITAQLESMQRRVETEAVAGWMLEAVSPPVLQQWAAVPPRSAAQGGRPSSITVHSNAPEVLIISNEGLLSSASGRSRRWLSSEPWERAAGAANTAKQDFEAAGFRAPACLACHGVLTVLLRRC